MIGPLSGLRFAVKDNIDVSDVPTTAACPAFSFVPSAHATVVSKLLNAGAALLGKTNLDQFACGLNGTRSPYGPVPNAVDPEYVSGGSSSGSAYVVASGEVDFALGTDTAGSGRIPAGLNHIVGLKPSRGLISTHGVLPAARSVDCVSIFARNVQTAWLVLTQAMGQDDQDPYSRELQLLSQPIPRQFVFGIPDTLEWYGDHAAENAFAVSIKQLEQLGGKAVVIDYRPLKKVANLLYGSALLAERLEAIGPFFKTQPDAIIEPVRTLLSAGFNFSGVDVFRALTELKHLSKQAAKMWRQIDVLLLPTAPTIYRVDDMLADPIELNRRLGYYTNFVNLLDYAALSVPSVIRTDGLPFGITLVGPAASDWQLAGLGVRHQQLIETAGAADQQTSRSLPPCPRPESPQVQVAVVGAHLSGMPLNSQLTERGGTLMKTTRTKDLYRLYALADTQPAKPGLLRVHESGASIEIEIWQMPASEFGAFVALIPSPLGIGQIETVDGESIHGFICEPAGLTKAQDITHFGGWRAYIASQAAHQTAST
ncbi:MAG: allophanate hydrolase [Burkholderiaceae bacterium]|nr:allophanate hydrolase [Burkholderiaceae bacterium]